MWEGKIIKIIEHLILINQTAQKRKQEQTKRNSVDKKGCKGFWLNV